MTSPTRRIVIDTSIARAAGLEIAVHPTAIKCRDFLKTVLACHHAMVITRDIQQEWNKHRSEFAHRWRYEMYSKKLVYHFQPNVDIQLRDKVTACCSNDKMRDVVLKDLRLIEAALCTDNTVTSLDDAIRRHFANICKTVKQIADLVWVNPDQDREDSIGWLKAGACNESKRLLKNYKYKNPPPGAEL